LEGAERWYGQEHPEYGYLSICEAYLILYSVTSRSSFEEVDGFREFCSKSKDSEKVPMVLIGNKCDLEDLRQVSAAEGNAKAVSFGCEFFETSAKTRHNVDDSFHEAVRAIRRAKREKEEQGNSNRRCILM